MLVSLAVLTAVSCGSSEAAGKPIDGTLRLEVGGMQGSLREALSAAGVVMAPAKHVRAVEPEPDPSGEPSPMPTPATAHEPTPPVPAPAVSPPAEPAERFRIVVLGRGQTLIHLAKIHLGNGNRFREILAANGWTEAQARRLPEGTKVRVPVDDGSAGRGNR